MMFQYLLILFLYRSQVVRLIIKWFLSIGVAILDSFSSIFSSTFLFFDVETEIIFVEFRWKGEKLGCYFEMEIVQTIVWKVLLH